MSLLASNTTPAERRRGCTFSDDFQSASRVAKNGGSVTGAPTFDIENGVTLDGTNDYLMYNLQGTEFSSDPVSIVIEFTPDFATSEDVSRYIYSTSPGTGYRVSKRNNSSANVLRIRTAGTLIADVPEATYSPYWIVGQRNVLVISGTSGDTDARLNGSAILTSAGTIWTPAANAYLWTGCGPGGGNGFDGTIHSVQIYKAKLTAKEAQDFYDNTTYSYPEDAIGIWDLTAASHDPAGAKTLDASGNGNYAIFGDGSTPTTYPTKLSNHRGYTFDGVNDYLRCKPILPAVYTVTYAKKVGNVLTIAHENVNTTWNQIKTLGSFTGDLLFLSFVPYVLTPLQELDLELRILKEINDV